MRQHSRGIAITALVAMGLPMLLSALGVAQRLSGGELALLLFAVVAIGLAWMSVTGRRSENDED